MLVLTTDTEKKLYAELMDLKAKLWWAEKNARDAWAHAAELRTALDRYEPRSEPEISTLGT
jgi:hypothetical protein